MGAPVLHLKEVPIQSACFIKDSDLSIIAKSGLPIGVPQDASTVDV